MSGVRQGEASICERLQRGGDIARSVKKNAVIARA